MDEFITNFTFMLRHVPYIREEKAEVQRFTSSLHAYMKEILEFDNPKMMDESIRKDRIYYQQMRQKGDNNKNWATKNGQNKFSVSENARLVGSKNINRKMLSGTPARGQHKFRSRPKVKWNEASSK